MTGPTTGGESTPLARAWVEMLHAVAFDEPPGRIGRGVAQASARDVQVALAAPCGASALVLVHAHDVGEPESPEHLAERLQTLLSQSLGRTIRCIATVGPLRDALSLWAESAGGSTTMVGSEAWAAAVETPPPVDGTALRLSVPVPAWSGDDAGTLVFESAEDARLEVHGAVYRAEVRADTEATRLVPVERSGPLVALYVAFDARLESVDQGRWRVAVAAEGIARSRGRESARARWMTDGERVGIRVDFADARTEPAVGNDVPTVALGRPEGAGVVQGRSGVATGGEA